MPLPLKTHTKKPWYVTWACDMEVTNRLTLSRPVLSRVGGPGFPQRLLDVHNRTHHPMQFLDPVRKAMSIFPVRVTAHAPCMQLRQDMLRMGTHETMPIICLRFPLGHLLLRGLRKRGDGPEAATKPVAIVHHRDSHRNLAWRPIPQPRQTGSQSTKHKGELWKRVSRTTQKTAHRVRTAHRTACTACRTSPKG